MKPALYLATWLFLVFLTLYVGMGLDENPNPILIAVVAVSFSLVLAGMYCAARIAQGKPAVTRDGAMAFACVLALIVIPCVCEWWKTA